MEEGGSKNIDGVNEKWRRGVELRGEESPKSIVNRKRIKKLKLVEHLLIPDDRKVGMGGRGNVRHRVVQVGALDSELFVHMLSVLGIYVRIAGDRLHQ